MWSDAKAVKYARKGFKVYWNLVPLTGQSLKWYIYCIQTQLNFENPIFPTFQTLAVGKTLKPYQGLKQGINNSGDSSRLLSEKP
jgi:hypothetical protein